ncbi:hypothetical protein CPB84DRAFT_1744249 [Gymnopilus junonius]|uniref:Uncharacterized protein n=1 Tax=Gymnopilus junonius TaxID=109634 RepID=A0A9P5TT09_GYMJU|nr:hypothetical protein CPB84DRAFT_1744249 [Gymnopilus junonius]
MGPPRKMPPQPSSSAMSSHYEPAHQPTSSRSTPLDTQIPPGAALGMSPASRYQHNLKVLRKRDPSIKSIFDQFSHVCIYHHDGSKWSKHGYEGTMFLFERNSYPPYGFYILNRSGLDDYIQGIYPEDQCLPSGEFLIIRSYPDFLARRLAAIQPTPSGELPEPFSDAYGIPNIDEIDPKHRGRPDVIGLWMMARQSDSENDQGNHSDAPSHMSGGMSEVEKLFDKLRKPVPTLTTGASLTMDTLFASASAERQDSLPLSPATSNTGIPLLDSIFASAVPPSPSPATQPIFSPQPTTTAPQVLTQDVLSNLLGLPPTRTASAASTFSTSASAVSHPSSREGDNEDDGESDSPGELFPPRSGTSVAKSTSSELLSTLGLGGPRLAAHGKINGDVTPRGPLNGHPLLRPPVNTTAISVETTTSSSTVRGDALRSILPVTPEGSGKPRVNRPLVPFEPDSEYWPYSRGPVVEQSPTDGNDDNDIVEISFEETSVLSDPIEFDKAVRHRRSAVSLRSSGTVVNGNGHSHVYASPAHASGADDSGTGRGKKGKKTRKELREAANAQMVIRGQRSSSAVPFVPEMKTPTMNGNAILGQINGANNYTASPHKAKAKRRLNGRARWSTDTGWVLATTYVSGKKMERNEFVKEVLTLIHTDKAFVDSLYQEYMTRFA